MNVPIPSRSRARAERCQHQGDDGLQIDDCSAILECPLDQHHWKISSEQSLTQVATENQHVEHESFQAWSVEAGQWGGRVMDVLDAPSSP